MPAIRVLLAALVSGPLLLAGASAPRASPFYTSNSIENSADFQTGPLAPNAIGTLYGTGLSYITAVLESQEISGGVLPTVLIGTGVNVLIGGIAANVFYVSPSQINFLVPSLLIPGPSNIQVVLDGIAGPIIPLVLAADSPALFQLDAQTAIATRPDGSVITNDAPANRGDVVILWATGLGDTVPPMINSTLATSKAPLKRLSEFTLLLDGAPLDASLILYAGIAPGYAGLYQINVQIPNTVNANPDVQIGLGADLSPTGVKLPLNPE
jgi:uncharacterized protein (TIGR03437 family)